MLKVKLGGRAGAGFTGFKQCKNELGWADLRCDPASLRGARERAPRHRVTDYAVIEKWWEVIMSAYLMVALHTPPLRPEGTVPPELDASEVVSAFVQHCDWQPEGGWKTWLNNLRLVLLPWVSANLLRPWQRVFPIPELERGFELLIELMNQFRGAPFAEPALISSA